MTCPPNAAPSATDGASTVAAPDTSNQARPIGHALSISPMLNDGGRTLIERRAGRLKFNNAIQRQRYATMHLALSRHCGGE